VDIEITFGTEAPTIESAISPIQNPNIHESEPLEPLSVLYRDDDLVVIDKPAGYHVHPPENPMWFVPKGKVILSVLRQQINQYLYPVHRLDAPTSGVLIFALNKKSASILCEEFAVGKSIQKKYRAIVRGFTKPEGFIDIPLQSDSSDEMLKAETKFRTLEQIELPIDVGKRPNSARYSVIELEPLTGRYHQLRRHCAQIAHPILGDIQHGDSYHNRFFRTKLDLPGLQLRCQEMNFIHPIRNIEMTVRSELPPLPWQEVLQWNSKRIL
jgi:tRNA pseudouridine65 synthase